MKEIKTKNGYVIFVDDEHYDYAMEFQWSVSRSDKYGQVYTMIDSKQISFKKLVLGFDASIRTLSKNGNNLDLRKENIIAFDTYGEYFRAMHQMGIIRADANSEFNEAISKGAQGRIPKDKKHSKYIGVTVVSTVRQYQAKIKYANKNYHLGSYEKEKYAAMAYDKKAIELFGSDARRNFPRMSYKKLCETLALIEKENVAIFKDNLSKRHQGRQFTGVSKRSKYVGVSPTKEGNPKPWRATISYQNKQHALGSFYTEVDAAAAYDNKAMELYGENARLNFPRKSG